MQSFNLYLPTKVYFGTNKWRNALLTEQQLLQKPVMVVTTGRSLYRLGYLPKVLEEICKIRQGHAAVVYDNISANPKLSEIKAGIQIARDNAIEVVIGFGGGSAMDAAKAVAAGIGLEQPIESLLFDGLLPSEKTPPIIAIPTTAGTGSELSKGAIISSPERGVKTGIRGEHIYPKVAIVDPIFTYQVPVNITMEAGFDVIAHAFESYISHKATYFSKGISEQVLQIAGKALQDLAKDIKDHSARERISYASMIAGINLGNVGTALPHRMQYPIGAQTDTSHAAGLMALYPSWIRHEYSYAKELVEQGIFLLTGHVCHTCGEVEEAFHRFIKALGVRRNLCELGIQAEQASELAKQVTGNIANDPVAIEVGIMEKIYSEAMD